MSDREVIRCPHCGLNQFMTVKKNCRRCHRLFVEPEPPAAREPVVKVRTVKVLTDNPVLPGERVMDFEFWMAFVLWDSRIGRNLSQGEVAHVMRVPRSYISKVETLGAAPHIGSIRRFCQVLETSPAHLVRKIDFLVTGN